MFEIERMITETKRWRDFHVDQRNNGVRGAGIEALACEIRLKALKQAAEAVRQEHSR